MKVAATSSSSFNNSVAEDLCRQRNHVDDASANGVFFFPIQKFGHPFSLCLIRVVCSVDVNALKGALTLTWVTYCGLSFVVCCLVFPRRM